MARQLDHDRVISALAASHHGVVSRRLLLENGISKDTIDMRLRQRRLVSVHRGVYALGHAQLRPEGRWLAAVEAVGTGAVLSHASAARLWGLDDAALLPTQVTVAKRSGLARRRGLVVHRVSELPDDEVTARDAIPVTTVARTLLDCAATVRERHLEQLIRRAARLRRFDRREAWSLVERHAQRPGAPSLGRLLVALADRGTADFRSRMEIAFAQLCDDYGLPRPVINGLVLGERVDFRWPGTTLVVETDGFEFHAMPTTFADDRRRDQKLTLAGYRVVRLTWDQVTVEAAVTARMIAALLQQCRAS
jgi:predicted transcriptional regulator of viral defense system